MFPLPTPPKKEPPTVKKVRVEETVMLFPSTPLFSAARFTTAPADVAVTPIGKAPKAVIRAARLAALLALPVPALGTTRKLVPILLTAAVRVNESAPCVIVKVPAGVPARPNTFPPCIAAIVGDTPARLVLNAT